MKPVMLNVEELCVPAGGYVVVEPDSEGGVLHSEQAHLTWERAEQERTRAAASDPRRDWHIETCEVWWCRCTACGRSLAEEPAQDHWGMQLRVLAAGHSVVDAHPVCRDCIAPAQ